MAQRTFSPKCAKCRRRTMALVTVPYDIQIDHDGRKHQVHVSALTVPRCSACGTLVIDDEADRVIQETFHKEAGLLTPEQIREGRAALGYSGQEFADCLGVAAATVSRWENGAQVQQRSYDGFIRAFFELPALREYLEGLHGIAHKRPAAKRAPEVNALEATGPAGVGPGPQPAGP